MRRTAIVLGRLSLAVTATLLLSWRADAQLGEGLALHTYVPQDYDRGRNISVQQTKRPDYDPLGIDFGSLDFFPRVAVGAGGTSNTYVSTSDPLASAFVSINPAAALRSDWSRHSIQLSGEYLARDYIGQSRRDEREWDVNAAGQLDVLRNFRINGIGDVARDFETPFTGELGANGAELSHYRRNFASVQATYTVGQTRSFLLADYTRLRFADIPLVSGGSLDQSDRDRVIERLTAQFEYARSPGLSFFGQLGGDHVNYDRDLLTGAPNLDSNAVRVLVGTNLDIAGKLRGTIGVGYSIQNYDASIYRTVRGVQVDSTIEFFPTQRLTLTLKGQRLIEDAALALRQRTPLWNTDVLFRADYELLRNVILDASAGYSHQKYLGTVVRGEIYRADAGASYLMSRRVSLNATASYRSRRTNDESLLSKVDEARITLSIDYHI